MHSTSTTNLKRDALGRIGYSRGQREALLDKFERSGLKGAERSEGLRATQTAGISYATLANWIQKRRVQ